jgi:pheromone shutdown protein TraB
MVGTGHVFRLADAVRDAIHATRPDHVFVELDRGRLHALMARRAGHTDEGKGGFIQRKLQGFQEELAKTYGAQAGEEMLAAAEAGRAVGARVHLIDPPAEETLRRVMKEMPLREKIRIVGMVVGNSLKMLLPGARKRGQAEVEAEIQRYQEDPSAMLQEVANRFPSVYRIVIAERDERMAGAIRRALPAVTHGFIVIGDGHVEGMARRLADVALEIYRLSDVREGRLPGFFADGTPEEVRFGFTGTA